MIDLSKPIWWRINFLKLPEMTIYTDAITMRDLLASFPDGVMTAVPFSPIALSVAADKTIIYHGETL
jgi:hypothetical protein